MTQQLLVEQHEALSGFLDDLLTESLDETGDVNECLADAHEPVEQDISEETGISHEQTPTSASAVEYITDNDLPLLAIDERVPVIPDWGNRVFQAMVFKVGELSLAVPLVELAGVVEWRPDPADNIDVNGFYLGRQPHAGQSVMVFDVARFIFPAERFEALCCPEPYSRISRIILIDKGKIGLACDEVFEVISIQPDQVNWRSEKTRRKWLAGTMLEQLTVVLDARTMAELLLDESNDLNVLN